MRKDFYSRTICIATNYNCNLNCIYCFEKHKTSEEFDINEAFKIISDQLNYSTPLGTKIKLHGGEPFLVFPKIKKLCEKLWSINFKEQYHIHLTTNGTLVHGEIQDWLYNNRDFITVKLSLDGDRMSNEINRPGSYDKIDIPFFLKCWPDIRINMTISPQTIPYVYENLKFLHSVGFRHIISHFALLKDWEEFSLEQTLFEQLNRIVNFYIENTQIKPCHLFSGNIANTLKDQRFINTCNLSRCKAFDFKTKKYYPCYMCFPSMAGERMSEELINMDLTNIENLVDPRCNDCPFINLCVTCYVENYITRGNLSLRDLSLCRYKKIVYALLFKFEYARIINLSNPTRQDVKKMQAIAKWQKEVNEILDNYTL